MNRNDPDTQVTWSEVKQLNRRKSALQDQLRKASDPERASRTPIAACLIAFTLAAGPVMAQTPPPGPTPQQLGAAGGAGSGVAQTTAPSTESSQGKVIGTPQEPGATEAKSWAQAVPITYMTAAVVGVTAAVLYVLYRRRRRDRE